MDDIKSLIASVRASAEKELEFCNAAETPTVCNMISTPEGKTKIIDLIVEYVGNNGMSISEAIVYIEREQNTSLNNE